MSGVDRWIVKLAQTASAEEVLWEEGQAETHPQILRQRMGTEVDKEIRLTDAEIDRVAQALCRRLLDAAGNM